MKTQGIMHETFVKYAEQILSLESPTSITSYALNSIIEVLNRENSEVVDERIIRLWIVTMMIDGKKLSTCKRYFSKVRALYSTWNTDSDDDVFASVSRLLSNGLEVDTKLINIDLRALKTILPVNRQSEKWQIVCIFFYLLYNPLASINDAVNLTFADAPRFCPQIDDIVNSFDSSYGRKYVFDLKQGKSRPHEIEKKLISELKMLLSSSGIRFENGFSRLSIVSLWISVAIKSGIHLQDIRNCIGAVPDEFSALTILSKSHIDDSTKESIICTVADSINSVVSRWFVMKLRSGITFDVLKERISEDFPRLLHEISLFYPSRTFTHKEGRKMITEEIPYLPDIVFFKTQTNFVKGIFAKIGDIAWCFKMSNSVDSDYAVVSNKQMSEFQQCIGRFTPDIKMELIDTQHIFEKGRKVRITGGLMAGYQGEIIDIADEPGKRIFFLSISDSMKARWTVHVEDVFIQPIEE